MPKLGKENPTSKLLFVDEGYNSKFIDRFGRLEVPRQFFRQYPAYLWASFQALDIFPVQIDFNFARDIACMYFLCPYIDKVPQGELPPMYILNINLTVSGLSAELRALDGSLIKKV